MAEYGGFTHDWAWSKGTLVQAPVSGTVKHAGFATGSYGNYLVITDEDGNDHYFAHMQGINRKLKEGMSVEVGTPLGKVGSSGNSTGPHLHYEIRAAAGGYLDPTSFASAAQGGRRALRYVSYEGGEESSVSAAADPARAVEPESLPRLGPNATDEQILEYIADQLPGAEDFLSVPALRRVILNYIRQAGDSVDASVLRSRIEGTDWWESRTQSARTADLLRVSDPTQYRSQVRTIAQGLRAQVNAIRGQETPWDWLFQKAERILRGDFTSEQFLENLTRRLARDDDSNIREDTQRSLGELAGAYLLDIGEEVQGNWAQRILLGTSTQEDYEAFLKQMAASRFPMFADLINSGATTRDIASPYVTLLSRELDRPYAVDDPMVINALTQGTTLSDFLFEVRSRPDWGGSTTARDSALELADLFGRAMGVTA